VRDVEQGGPVAGAELHARQRGVAAQLLANAVDVAEEQRGHDAGRRDAGVVLQPAARTVDATDGRVLDEVSDALVEAGTLGFDVMLELGPARVSQLAGNRPLCVGEPRRVAETANRLRVPGARSPKQLFGALPRLLEIDGRIAHDDLLGRPAVRGIGREDVVSIGSCVKRRWAQPFPRTGCALVRVAKLPHGGGVAAPARATNARLSRPRLPGARGPCRSGESRIVRAANR
jgi:hypothetical protein